MGFKPAIADLEIKYAKYLDTETLRELKDYEEKLMEDKVKRKDRV